MNVKCCLDKQTVTHSHSWAAKGRANPARLHHDDTDAKGSVRDIYLTAHSADAATVLDKAIGGCRQDDVAEIRGLGRTLARWRPRVSFWTRRRTWSRHRLATLDSILGFGLLPRSDA